MGAQTKWFRDGRLWQCAQNPLGWVYDTDTYSLRRDHNYSAQREHLTASAHGAARIESGIYAK
jgi:hypothetical protein